MAILTLFLLAQVLQYSYDVGLYAEFEHRF